MTNTICPFCRIAHKTIVPTIHTNGTSADELRDQIQTAIDAVFEAQHKLEQAAPNGRDYYPQGDLLGAAMNNHERRWHALNRILTELEEQRDHVLAVIDFKAARR